MRQLVCAGHVNMLGGNASVMKITEVMLQAREIGLEVNTEETKYMVMSRHQNVGKVKVKMNLSLCFDKNHAMKAYWGWRYSATHSRPRH
jgi:hypothetical protein